MKKADCIAVRFLFVSLLQQQFLRLLLSFDQSKHDSGRSLLELFQLPDGLLGCPHHGQIGFLIIQFVGHS